MNILICNVGSTSLKYQLFDMEEGEKVLCSGGAERVGGAKSVYYHKDSLSGYAVREEAVFPTHREAISAMLEAMLKGCVSWAKENNVTLITDEHVKIINDKRKQEKENRK